MSATQLQRSRLDEQTAFEIGVEAYVYFYPLVLMDVTRRQATNVVRSGDVPRRGPLDTFAHSLAVPPATFRDVIRPNFDTLYSAAWLDLHEEPRVISVPAAGEEYYLMPLYDMWTDVFASPGVRTTGDDANDFVVCPPGWEGELPEGLHRYDAPTPFVWVINRVEAMPATYDRIHEFQRGMSITPLHAWGGEPEEVVGTVDPTIDGKTPPLHQVAAMDAATFFSYAADLLMEHAPHAADYSILDLLEKIGFVRGEAFDIDEVDGVVRAALERAVPVGQKRIADAVPKGARFVDGWAINTDVMGAYGVWYLKRAATALAGLGANLPTDAVYPLALADADGAPFIGANRYVWHLEEDNLPPARAFWSLTMYDAEGFPVPNEIDRCAIGDRDDLVRNEDGSLDIAIQHERPTHGTSNWLPAPEGAFTLAARLYWPAAEVLDGTWTPPPVVKVAG